MITPTAINDFLLSLTVAIAAAAELAGPAYSTDAPASMFLDDAVEGMANEVYTVLRQFDGAEPGSFVDQRVPSLAIQLDTRGGDGEAVRAQAWLVHEALLEDSNSRLWEDHLIPAKTYDDDGVTIVADGSAQWRVRISAATPPGIRGRDEADRKFATSNFDCEFDRVA